jgi:hypothetical protein
MRRLSGDLLRRSRSAQSDPKRPNSCLVALVACMLLLLVAASPAHARWARAGAIAHGMAPRAATGLQGGGVAVWAGTRSSRRLAWLPGALGPVAFALPPFVTLDDEQPWDANGRGDVVMLGAADRTVTALVVEASGLQAPMSAVVARGRAVGEVAGAIGDDGTAVVAWSAERNDDDEEEPGVWLRVRAPGGQFGLVVALAAGGPVRQLDADVAPDGGIEVVYAFWDGRRHVLVHTDVGSGSVPGEPITVATTPAGSPVLLGLVAGGPGVGRVLYSGNDEDRDTARAIVMTRSGATEWASRQVLEAGSGDPLGVIEPLRGGGAVVAYNRGSRLLVRRAAPGAPFGPAQHAGRVPRRWLAVSPAVASTLRGDLLVAWNEVSDEDEAGSLCGDGFCFGRVVAAAASPGKAFGPERLLSPLGTVLGDAPPVAGLSADGRRLVAWQTASTDGSAPDALWASIGDATPDVPMSSDRRAPRVRVTPSRRALRAAARSGSLRIGFRCDEPCAVRVSLYDDAWEDGIDGLSAVVLHGSRTTTTAWPLQRRDRRVLRRALDDGRPYLIGSAADTAGNVRIISLRPA